MKGYPITFNIYAESEEEAKKAQQDIIGFIRLHAQQGRAVSATKISSAVSRWDANPFVRNQIINFLKK